MPNWRRRFDRHSQRLFMSERLSPFDQLREIAMEACLIRMSVGDRRRDRGAEASLATRRGGSPASSSAATPRMR